MKDTTKDKLLDAVRKGRAGDVPELVKALDAAERKAALAELKTLRTTVRGWGWDRWDERRRVHQALLVAGAGCHGGAAATAAWIGARDLRDWGTPLHALLLDVLRDRDGVWLADVAHRLAGRPATARDDYPLIHDLVRLSGCPVPVTDGYVYGWVDALWRRHQGHPRLADDPQTPVLVPRLFETAELAGQLTWGDKWAPALVSLIGDGVVDRAVLVDGCVARLLRGGKPSELRFFLDLLRHLEPTVEEERARTADWMAMAADAPSTVAGHALEVLSRLALSGDLPARQLAEVSTSVLFRTEKKLVRAQLVLLGKALRCDRGASAELLPAVAEVFGHEDTAVQERALKLVGRYLNAVDEELRLGLARSAAELLSPVHRAAAAELFGELPEADGLDEPYEELLPPVPEPQRLAPAAGTRAELVEEVAALLRQSQEAPAIDVERALDGLVRYAYEDVEDLREALLPLVTGLWWYENDRVGLQHLDGVHVVVAAVLGRVTAHQLHGAQRQATDQGCVHRRLARIPVARAQEAAWRMLTKPVPFLLATPTWHTGTIDPGELVERLAAYGRLGARTAECDFAQALLRVRRTGPGVAEAVEAATRLGTPEGARLAAWLTDGEPFGPSTRTVVDVSQYPANTWFHTYRRIVLGTPEQLVIQREFPPAFRALGRPWDPTGNNCYHWGGGEAGPATAVLPEDRETLAAWLLPLATGAADADIRGGADFLPALAEAGGEAGPALHLTLGCGLGARHTEDRLAAVDTLLVLAARKQLDAERLGGDLAALVDVGTVKVNRLADALRTAAATGAYGTVWAVLAGALPALLTGGEPPRGLGEILAVAAECAERSGAGRGTAAVEVPGLEAVAARRGSSQLVVQAKRLANALRTTAEQTTT